MLGDRRRECDHVVLRRLLDLVDPSDVEAPLGGEIAGRFAGHDAGVGHGLGGGHFDLQPGFEAALLAPDPAHLGMGITGNHRAASTARERETLVSPTRQRSCLVPLVKSQLLPGNLEAIHVAEDRRCQRITGKELLGQALHVGDGDPLNRGQHLVE